jgi:hypothetical protein
VGWTTKTWDEFLGPGFPASASALIQIRAFIYNVTLMFLFDKSETSTNQRRKGTKLPVVMLAFPSKNAQMEAKCVAGKGS